MSKLDEAKQLVNQLVQLVNDNTTHMWTDDLEDTFEVVVLEDVREVNESEYVYDVWTNYQGDLSGAEALADEWNKLTNSDKFSVRIPRSANDNEFLIVGYVTRKTLKETTIEDEFIVLEMEGYCMHPDKMPLGNEFTGDNIRVVLSKLQTLLND